MPSPTALHYLSDSETKVDYLNNEAIAKTILRLVLTQSDKPMTVGVHGDWGAGKSSVLEMVENSLVEHPKTVCLKFNGWQFQGFEDAKIALIEGVVTGLIEKRSLYTKAAGSVKDVWESLDKLKFLKGAGKFGVALSTGIPIHGLGLADMVGAFGSNAVDVATDPDKRSEVAESFEDVVKEDAKFGRKSAPKEIDAFRKAFKKLIEVAQVDRIVVLVDDLDRCLPETAIETLEAIRLFVLMEKTVFIVGADERMIEYAVHRHFPHLPQMEDSQGYARAYLEKLLQIPFRIPALGEMETRIYVMLLLLGSVLDNKDDADTFASLLELGRAALSRPWEGTGFADKDIQRVLGSRMDDLRPILVTAEQISPVLSAGTKGNPRQIKRFLNALTLRLAVAEDRNFGSAIEQTHLAKLMLAEMFLPESVFAYIASSAANAVDGICPALNALESPDHDPAGGDAIEWSGDEGAGSEAKKGAPIDVQETVAAWRINPDVVRWAKVKPNLGDVSLKPYLFVIKDRKNYLSSDAPLSSVLIALIARLTGGSGTAASASGDVKKLDASDLNSVFDGLKTQVLASSSFDAKPLALVGIETMVKAVPALQDRYVDVLEALPVARLSQWAAAGYGPLVKSEAAKARLNRLLARWKKDGGVLLKKALDTVDRPAHKASAG